MEKQITDLKSLQGKIIEKTKADKENFWIKFTDGTFVVLTIEDITEGFGYTKNQINIEDCIVSSSSVLIELNILSEKDFKKNLEKEEIKYQNYIRKQEQEELERIRKEELALLNSLKHKYEK